MEIRLDDLSHPAVHALLGEHLANMYELSAAESVHALDVDRLRVPEITFWTVWEEGDLLGCGALKELDSVTGEVKSMRTPEARRRKGAGREILQQIIATARARGYSTLYLETGSREEFEPARSLYRRAGFTLCGPFPGYVEDPNSVFMKLSL